MIHKKHFIDISIYKNVTFLSPSSVYIEENVLIGEGTLIEPNVMITNGTKIGINNKIYFGACIKKSTIGNNCIIGQNTLIRDGTILKNNVIIGPYCEIARSVFESNSAVYHSSVILDTHIKSYAKLGAGIITANTKHDNIIRKITINEHAKLGINVSLLAPLNIGKNSWIAAGSTINKDVKTNSTVIARSRQKEIKKV